MFSQSSKKYQTDAMLVKISSDTKIACKNFPTISRESKNSKICSFPHIDLVLVSTAVQRLHLSEFEFLFQVCEYFHVARHLFKHWTKIVKSQNKKTTEDDGGLSLSPLQLATCNLTQKTPSSNVATKPLLAELIQVPPRSTP